MHQGSIMNNVPIFVFVSKHIVAELVFVHSNKINYIIMGVYCMHRIYHLKCVSVRFFRNSIVFYHRTHNFKCQIKRSKKLVLFDNDGRLLRVFVINENTEAM